MLQQSLLPTHSQSLAAYCCKSALGSVLHHQPISNFSKKKQVYKKQELSPLPLNPPAFYEYFKQIIVGAAKVMHDASVDV